MKKGRFDSGPRRGARRERQLRSARGAGVVLSVAVYVGAGVAATGSAAAGAAAGGLFQLVVLVVVVRVVDDVSSTVAAGALVAGSAFRLPSRFNGAPGGVP